MTALHCPLPACDWSVPYLSPPEPTGIPDFDQHMREAADLNKRIAAQIRDLHLDVHTPTEFARAVAASSPAHRDERTLFLLCPMTGCRWERDVDLREPGFWRGLFMPGPEVMAMSAHAERERHLARHHVPALARTLEHLTPKDTP